MEASASPSRGARARIDSALRSAGVEPDGPAPHDLHVINERFYQRVTAHGTLGFGDSYVDGDWECERLDELVYRLIRAGVHRSHGVAHELGRRAAAFLTNPARTRAFAVGERHYDLGNDLFEWMLGPRLIYSCGYWKDAGNLEAAQDAKLDLVCRKLGLRPGMRVLDVGCGWGGFARFAAERYGVSVHGITVSREQVERARRDAGSLPVTIELQDYRELDAGTFDAVASIGMFEHVGVKNYGTFFDVVRRCLSDDGLFLLHTIGGNESSHTTDPWIERYIFPNSLVPSLAQIASAAEGRFVVEDLHNIGADYERTLLAWNANVESHREKVEAHYGARFLRMWRFYLLSCAGAFRARYNNVWQIVLSPRGVAGGYRAPR
ncbi:MAG TPA: cyclopropane fatty acyl phospholipid synthase [Thermoanaerobaculia bacterium]|nr:cyclopropane fatty acyl phospholipid synthase [Thermoanaerobaculia bacterium]